MTTESLNMDQNISKDPNLVNGGWGSWAYWSSCDYTKKKQKIRSCSNPTPKNGGNK